jgi:hypothetical protein
MFINFSTHFVSHTMGLEQRIIGQLVNNEFKFMWDKGSCSHVSYCAVSYLEGEKKTPIPLIRQFGFWTKN